MGPYIKHFTVNEARSMLPALRRNLLKILDLIAEIRAYESHAGVGRTLILRGNGKGPIITGTGQQKEDAQKRIEEIASQGIIIKDLEPGLVDFPHYLGDDETREVFLCWKLGEDTIETWHEIDAGFGGRRPLDPD